MLSSLCFQDWISLSQLIVLLLGFGVAWRQLRKTAASSTVSALTQISAGQRAISEIMLNNDDLLAIAYPRSTKEEARKKIFLTLLINNASLAFAQLSLGIVDRQQREAFREHLRKEFKDNRDFKDRLETTKSAYDPSFVSFILGP